jgi:osmotically-inducible protein OsmY
MTPKNLPTGRAVRVGLARAPRCAGWLRAVAGRRAPWAPHADGDRPPHLGTQLEDQHHRAQGLARVRVLPGRGHVNVTSYNRLVLMTGEVPTDADRQAVEQAVSRIENVRAVVNELAVMGASSSARRARSNDAILTSKVKAASSTPRTCRRRCIKVVTERGTVYLMGRVTEREANRATDVARCDHGVQKVVKVFEIC